MENTTPFTIYNASAGSGKTFTLVKNYLSLLFTAPRKDFYKNILAITFTNKAVAEMKTRVIDSLKAFSESPLDPSIEGLFKEVQKEIQLSEAIIREKSAVILKNLLHNYAAFEISTIDSFNHRILRTFAKDIGIPLNFEVELDSASILSEAVDRLIEKAGKDKELTKTLINFAISKADDDKSWDISRDLNEIAQLLVKEDNLVPLKELSEKTIEDFTEFSKNIKAAIKSLKEEAQNQAEAFFELMETHGLDEKDFSGGYIPKYFKKFKTSEILKAYPTRAKWQLTIETEPLYNKSQTPEKKSIIDGLQAQIANLYQNASGATVRIDFLNRIQKKTTSLSLLKAIENEVEGIKNERNLLLIAEFNNKISENIQNQPAPFIYERLGERYQDYFIDEFQDTSAMQWNNLTPLISNSLSTISREGRLGSLTLVGDAKQSIYRWRGGKAEQFIGLSQHQNPFSIEKSVQNLPANYRSLPEVVHFNNEFFKHVSDFLSFEVYKNLYQNAAQEPIKEKGGFVDIRFLEAKNKEEEEKVQPEEAFSIIQSLSAKGYAKKDMCILVRKKKEGFAIANYLSEQGVPIISSETLLIKQCPAVNFINNILAFSLNNQDKNLKFEILDFLHQHFEVSESPFQFMNAKLELDGEAFFDSLKELQLYFSINTLQQLPLYDAVEYIIRSFSLMKNQGAHLQFYADFVYEYTQKNLGGIAGFLDHWKTKEEKLSIIAPEGEDAVQIMTIHTSKGLEFPIVIYPFANESIDDTRMDSLWVNLEKQPNTIPLAYLDVTKNMLDYNESTAVSYQELLIHKELDTFNLFYVAMTRAKEQLYILSNNDVDSKGVEKTNKLSGLLIHFLKTKGRWNNSLQYTFGEEPQKLTEIVSEETPLKEAYFHSSAPSDHQVNVITKSGSLWGTAQEKSIQQGNIIHEILAEVISAKDIEKALQQAINEGFILKKEAPHYHKQLLAIVEHPELSTYFSGNQTVYTEKEIIAEDGYKRLDRLCIDENLATIIDYKTGAFSLTHKNQLDDYARSIEKMGYTVNKKLLVYLDNQVTIKNV